MDFSYVFSHGDAVLISVFLLLFLMSFASWYVIFWKGLKLREEYKSFRKFHGNYANIVDWPKSVGLVESEKSVAELFGVVKKLEKILPKYKHEGRKEILTMHLIQSLDEIRFRLDHGLTILASVGSAAPFIGLFGTVWGIYNTLTSISQQQSAGLNVIAGPMGEALAATAVGLFAAIPAVLAYNAFVRLNKLLVQNLRHIAEQLTSYLSNNELGGKIE